jgi:hypothetical protein
MDIKRFDSMDDLPPLGAHIVIRRTSDGKYNLGFTLDDAKSRLVGIYDSAEAAEREGLAVAEKEGIDCLHVVNLADQD